MIFYKRPFVQQDGSVVVDQVTIIAESELENGVKRRELRTIQELYPSMEVLKNTIELASKNLSEMKDEDPEAMKMIQAERYALEGLIEHLRQIEAGQ